MRIFPVLATFQEKIRVSPQKADFMLVKLQDGDNSAPPLFCVPPAGGSALVYGELARCLPKLPIYTIKILSLAEEKKYSGLADRAARYFEIPYRFFLFGIDAQ